MRIILVLSILFACFHHSLTAQSAALYDDSRVSSIYLEIPADSLAEMIALLEDEYYYHARFIFDDGQYRDTLENIGLRLRGNTSLGAQKKSFKISFNEYVSGREYQDVRKLNLRALHNDPTMTREKLFYDVWNQAGRPERRAAFARLYINGEYRGLYTNIEELDKQWLGRIYPDNDGNLWKCTWPANLVYMGPDQETYKAIMNNPEERAYDLKTNEDDDDYSRLVELITALNQPVDAGFPDDIRQILDVDGVLEAFAIDVATGNWDDYFYNQNNYYLYDNPTTGRFEFITYDTDNTFGIDWLGIDWAKRNALTWHHQNMQRPMASKLLAVPEFKAQYVRFLDSITQLIVRPDVIFPYIDELHEMITSAAEEDTYRTLDYGYSIDDFHHGYTQTIDNHTPWGIKPFLERRRDSTLSQIEGLIEVDNTEAVTLSPWNLFPNPVVEGLWIMPPYSGEASEYQVTLFSGLGQPLAQWGGLYGPFYLHLAENTRGIYYVRIEFGANTHLHRVVKMNE